MKKIIFTILILISYLFKAQETTIDTLKYRAEYILSYQIDSTNIYSKDQENFKLLIGYKKSLFVSENGFKRDSLKNELLKTKNISNLNLTNTPKTAFSFRIVKKVQENNITFYDLFFRTAINYNEKVNLKWELTSSKESIGNLMCGIAYVDYGGRRYKTWYSLDISIPEGPYKFFGLPGLIVKIEDTKGYYKFELANFKDVSSEKIPIQLDYKLLNGVSVTKQEYLSARKNYFNNIGVELSRSGITIGNDAIRNVQEREKKKNNPIE